MLMARSEIVLNAIAGTRLVEVRHGMTRGLSVSRYGITTPNQTGFCAFPTLRKARAAFRLQVAEAQSDAPVGARSA